MKKYWGVFCFDQFEFSIFASKKSTTNRFVSRNANFSGKVWPRLRPAGSQGRERIWDDDGDNIAILVILTRMSDAGWKWTRFWPGGNELLVIQGIIRLLNRNYLDPDKDWWWLSNFQVRGTTKYHLSPHEQKAFAGVISTGVPNTLWRIRWWTWGWRWGGGGWSWRGRRGSCFQATNIKVPIILWRIRWLYRVWAAKSRCKHFILQQWPIQH